MAIDLGEYGDPARRLPPAPRPPRPRRPWSGRRALVTATAVLLAAEVVVLGSRVSVQHAPAADPATAARELFAALAAGDAGAAQALLSGPRAATAVLAGPALRDQGAPRDARVTGVERHGDTATVTVSYVVGGTPGRSVLTERRERTGVLRAPRWRVLGGLPVLRLSAPAYESAVLVSGQRVALHGGRAQVVVFPGSVVVLLPPRLPSGALARTVAATGGGVDVALRPSAAGSVRVAVQDAVSDRLLPALLAASLARGVTVAGLQITTVSVREDGATLDFSGATTSLHPNRTTGQTFAEQEVAVSGTAVYADGSVRITALSPS